jgi:hypothetical protein
MKPRMVGALYEIQADAKPSWEIKEFSFHTLHDPGPNRTGFLFISKSGVHEMGMRTTRYWVGIHCILNLTLSEK